MFEPDEESLVLEIVRSFFDISAEEMIKVGDQAKELLFGPGADSEEAMVAGLKAALEGMSKEQALISGMFISGLLRCNLAQQCRQAMEEADGCQEPEGSSR